MSTEDNKALARRCYEAFNNFIKTGDFAPVAALLAADGVDHNPAPGQAPGIAGVRQAFDGFRAGFPDLTFTVEDQIAEGDQVVSRMRLSGTHTGSFMGVPASGRPITQTGIDILRIANGQVVERWGEFDNLGLMMQIGAVPPPQE